MKLKIQVPERLGKALKCVASILGDVFDCTVAYLIAAVVISAITLISLRAPEMHNHWLRTKVGSKVYTIRDSAHSGGGTGFAIKAPSGVSYILTNDHVCGVSSDKQTVLVTDEEGNGIRRRIIAHDDSSDLCLIEGLPSVQGLSLAGSEASVGDTMIAVGHPHLLPLTLSKGEFIGKKDVQIMMGIISVTNPESGEVMPIPPEKGGMTAEQCAMPKNKIVEIPYIFGIMIRACMVNIHDAYQTNVQVLPGNSGSPVVNFWGNVEAVVFASDDSVFWGSFISLYDIRYFLRNY